MRSFVFAKPVYISIRVELSSEFCFIIHNYENRNLKMLSERAKEFITIYPVKRLTNEISERVDYPLREKY